MPSQRPASSPSGDALRGSAPLTRLSRVVAVLAALLAVGGCGAGGRDDSPADSTPPAAASATAPAAATTGSPDPSSAAPADSADAAAPDPNTNMVSAVNPAGGTGPLSVKFRVEARPIVGMPVKIILALIPDGNAQIGHIHGSLLTSEGLQLQSERSFDIAPVPAGTPLYREVTVVPQQSGVLSLNATLLLETDKSTETRTYSIPLLAAAAASS